MPGEGEKGKRRGECRGAGRGEGENEKDGERGDRGEEKVGREAGEAERGPGRDVKGRAGKEEGKSRREGERGRKRKKGTGGEQRDVTENISTVCSIAVCRRCSHDRATFVWTSLTHSVLNAIKHQMLKAFLKRTSLNDNKLHSTYIVKSLTGL